MTYSAVYCALITNRLQNPIEKGCGTYVEKHHIIPKSEGGSDEESNLVYLTAREHYIAHLLLAKIYDDMKMWCAIHRLVHGNKKHYTRVSSRMYQKIKESNALLAKSVLKGKKRPPRSKEWSNKISESKRGIPSKRKGVSLSANIGKTWWHKGTKNFFGYERPDEDWVKGLYQNPEKKSNGGKAIIGMRWFNNGIIEVKKRECPEGFVKGRLVK